MMKETRHNPAAIYGVFLLSGMAGLSYEVVWMRKLALIFGATAPAVSAVISAYLMGLAVGAYMFGKYSSRFPEPIKTYGYMEGIVGVYCALSPFIFMLFGLIEESVGGHVPMFLRIPWRFVFALALMAVPTAMMGATLPALIKAVARGDERAKDAGLLYGINTTGAALGAAITGFVLLPSLGEIGSVWIAAIANIAIAVFAVKYLAPMFGAAKPDAKVEKIAAATPTADIPGNVVTLVVALFALGGFLSITYEVYWTRLLSLVIGTTTYAFTLMLATFILALGLGSLAFSRFAQRSKNPVFLFGLVEIGIAFFVLAGTPLIDNYPDMLIKLYARANGDFGSLTFYTFGIAALVMFVPAFLMGAAFPCVSRIVSAEKGAFEGAVGSVYAYNTVGGIVGAVVATFVVIPAIGTKSGIMVSAALNMAVGVLAVAMSNRKGGWKIAGGLALATLLAFMVSMRAWNEHKIARGIFFQLDDIKMGPEDTLDLMLTGEKVLYLKEDASATVLVVKDRTTKVQSIVINGKAEASTGLFDLAIEYMLGHVPVFLANNPKNALVVGMGTGTTLGSVAVHSDVSVNLAEISPAVIPAARYFALTNHSVLDRPNLKINLEDGRHFLLHSPEGAYDLITSDPIHPFNPGGSSLYTLDYYRLAKSRLKSGGVFCQWLPLYQLSREDIRTIIATFVKAFPESSLWMAYNDSLLIGWNGEAQLDYAGLLKKFDSDPNLKADMKRMGINNGIDLIARLALGPDQLKKISEGAPVTTDDMNLLEFSSPKSLFRDTIEENWRMIRDGFDFAALLKLLGLDETSGAALKPAFEAARLDIDGIFYYANDDTVNAGRLFMDAIRLRPDFSAPKMHVIEILLSPVDALVAQDKIAEAKERVEKALEIDPENAPAMMWMARHVAIKGDYGYARNLLDHAHKNAPWDADILAELGLMYMMLDREGEAMMSLKEAIRLEPDRGRAYYNLGLLYRKMGDKEKAIENFTESIRQDPTNADALNKINELKAQP